MQSLSILSDVDPADFIRSDAPISQFARGSHDRFPAEPASNADDGRLLIGSRPSVLETAQAFGGVNTGMPRQFQQSYASTTPQLPQLSSVPFPAPPNVSHHMSSFQKNVAIRLPPQVLLVLVDGRNGDAVIDRLSNSSAASRVALSTGDRLKSIDGHMCSNASEALASIQSLTKSSGADVELSFLSRSGALSLVAAGRQQVRTRARFFFEPFIGILCPVCSCSRIFCFYSCLHSAPHQPHCLTTPAR